MNIFIFSRRVQWDRQKASTHVNTFGHGQDWHRRRRRHHRHDDEVDQHIIITIIETLCILS